MSVTPIGTNVGVGVAGAIGRVSSTGGQSQGADFAQTLANLVDNVEKTNSEANTAVTGMLNGTGEVHDAMIALHEAEEALEITVAIRNKFVQAYQEIMRMGM
jgi:flagellar hook-basal body complex protein FliE